MADIQHLLIKVAKKKTSVKTYEFLTKKSISITNNLNHSGDALKVLGNFHSKKNNLDKKIRSERINIIISN